MDFTAEAAIHSNTSRGRDKVLAELRSGGEALHPGLLAARVGFHVSTVRRHLQGLASVGLVERVADEREGAGRPRVLYRATTSPGEGMPVCIGYRFVAESLARWLEASSDDAWSTAVEIGDAWGRHLVHAPPLTHTTREQAIERVFDVLAELEYAPSRVSDDGTTLELGRCPFQQLSAFHPDVGCGLHVGIVRGALAGLGADVEVGEVHVAAGRPDETCTLRLVESRTPHRHLA